VDRDIHLVTHVDVHVGHEEELQARPFARRVPVELMAALVPLDLVEALPLQIVSAVERGVRAGRDRRRHLHQRDANGVNACGKKVYQISMDSQNGVRENASDTFVVNNFLSPEKAFFSWQKSFFSSFFAPKALAKTNFRTLFLP